MGGETVRVALIEDHAVVREGLRLLLSHEPGIDVVGDAGTGEAGLELCRCLAAAGGVDVVVTDLGLPDLDGLEVTAQLKARFPRLRVLVLSALADDAHVLGMLAAGADGYLLKYAAGHELIAAVRAVARGETVLSPPVARRLLERRRAPTRRVDLMSEREREVLTMLVGGATTKAVARQLGLSPKTVENCRARILAKLGAANTAAAVRIALDEGLFPPPASANWHAEA